MQSQQPPAKKFSEEEQKDEPMPQAISAPVQQNLEAIPEQKSFFQKAADLFTFKKGEKL